jgi:hypothetical protein
MLAVLLVSLSQTSWAEFWNRDVMMCLLFFLRLLQLHNLQTVRLDTSLFITSLDAPLFQACLYVFAHNVRCPMMPDATDRYRYERSKLCSVLAGIIHFLLWVSRSTCHAAESGDWSPSLISVFWGFLPFLYDVFLSCCVATAKRISVAFYDVYSCRSCSPSLLTAMKLVRAYQMKRSCPMLSSSVNFRLMPRATLAGSFNT